MKPGGEQLGLRRIRQEVAGELLDRKLIKRQVSIERVDDVVAVGPDAARLIVGVPLGVRITGKIEPAAGPVFAVRRLRELGVHEALIRIRPAVGGEGLDLRQRRRQAGQVERNAAGQREAVGLGLRAELGRLELRKDEAVHGALGPRGVLHRGQRGAPGFLVGPMRRVTGPAGDPAAQEVDFRRGQYLARLARRHDVIVFRRRDPTDEFAFLRMTLDYGKRPAPQGHPRAVRGIEAQALGGTVFRPALAILLVGPVAAEALVGKNRADLSVEVGHGGAAQAGDSEQKRGEREGVRGDPHGQADT